MKKSILGLFLAGASVFALAACDNTNANVNNEPAIVYTDESGNEKKVDITTTDDSVAVASVVEALLNKAQNDKDSFNYSSISQFLNVDANVKFNVLRTSGTEMVNISGGLEGTVKSQFSVSFDSKKAEEINDESKISDLLDLVGLYFDLDVDGKLYASDGETNHEAGIDAYGKASLKDSQAYASYKFDKLYEDIEESVLGEEFISEAAYLINVESLLNGLGYNSTLTEIVEEIEALASDYIPEEATGALDGFDISSVTSLIDFSKIDASDVIDALGLKITKVEGSSLTFDFKISGAKLANVINDMGLVEAVLGLAGEEEIDVRTVKTTLSTYLTLLNKVEGNIVIDYDKLQVLSINLDLAGFVTDILALVALNSKSSITVTDDSKLTVKLTYEYNKAIDYPSTDDAEDMTGVIIERLSFEGGEIIEAEEAKEATN